MSDALLILYKPSASQALCKRSSDKLSINCDRAFLRFPSGVLGDLLRDLRRVACVAGVGPVRHSGGVGGVLGLQGDSAVSAVCFEIFCNERHGGGEPLSVLGELNVISVFV